MIVLSDVGLIRFRLRSSLDSIVKQAHHIDHVRIPGLLRTDTPRDEIHFWHLVPVEKIHHELQYVIGITRESLCTAVRHQEMNRLRDEEFLDPLYPTS
jgi:hypothetical protein